MHGKELKSLENFAFAATAIAIIAPMLSTLNLTRPH